MRKDENQQTLDAARAAIESGDWDLAERLLQRAIVGTIRKVVVDSASVDTGELTHGRKSSRG